MANKVVKYTRGGYLTKKKIAQMAISRLPASGQMIAGGLRAAYRGYRNLGNWYSAGTTGNNNRKEVHVVPTAEGTSTSFHGKYPRKGKKQGRKKGVSMKKNINYQTPPWTFESVNTFLVTSGNQGQGIGTAANLLYDQGIIRQLYAAATQTQSGVGLNLTNNGGRSFKLYLQDCISTVHLQNCNLNSVMITIYDYLYKKDQQSGTNVTTFWNNGIVAQDYNTPSIYSPYTVPTTSRYFNEAIKILKTTHVELGGNRSHEHTWKYCTNRMFDTLDSEENVQVGGLSAGHMIVVKGQLADNFEGIPTSWTQANYAIELAPSKVIGLQRVKYQGRLVSNVGREYVQVNNLNNAIFGTSYANNSTTASYGINIYSGGDYVANTTGSTQLS